VSFPAANVRVRAARVSHSKSLTDSPPPLPNRTPTAKTPARPLARRNAGSVVRGGQDQRHYPSAGWCWGHLRCDALERAARRRSHVEESNSGTGINKKAVNIYIQTHLYAAFTLTLRVDYSTDLKRCHDGSEHRRNPPTLYKRMEPRRNRPSPSRHVASLLPIMSPSGVDVVRSVTQLDFYLPSEFKTVSSAALDRPVPHVRRHASEHAGVASVEAMRVPELQLSPLMIKHGRNQKQFLSNEMAVLVYTQSSNRITNLTLPCLLRLCRNLCACERSAPALPTQRPRARAASRS
jgi:hypothetical protein